MKWIPLIGATLGAVVAILGTVLYQLSPHGETGLLAGKGGIFFWYLSFPGSFVGAGFEIVGISSPWSTVLGSSILWGIIAFAIGAVFSRRHRDA